MTNQKKFYLGIDVSKEWFDLSVLPVFDHVKQEMQSERFENTKKGLNVMKKWLKLMNVTYDVSSLLVIENTGIYHRLIWQHFGNHNLPIHIGNGAAIKWSLGIARGKSDKIDSKRLCNYAFKNADELKASTAPDPVFTRLRDLITSRTRLKSQFNANKVYLRELKAINDKATQANLEMIYKQALEGLTKSIKTVEHEIDKITKTNSAIKTNYDLLLTVPGIGPRIAVYIICCTNNFAGEIKGKQLASYAGLAPFPYESGKSIKGKNKVHKMANKELKSLLHMGALSAIKYYEEFRHYYDRKAGEGKHPNSILNAIANKIVLRASAVVNNQRKYVNNFTAAA
jgi:transposase